MATPCKNHLVGMIGIHLVSAVKWNDDLLEYARKVHEFDTSKKALHHPGFFTEFRNCPTCGVKIDRSKLLTWYEVVSKAFEEYNRAIPPLMDDAEFTPVRRIALMTYSNLVAKNCEALLKDDFDNSSLEGMFPSINSRMALRKSGTVVGFAVGNELHATFMSMAKAITDSCACPTRKIATDISVLHNSVIFTFKDVLLHSVGALPWYGGSDPVFDVSFCHSDFEVRACDDAT